jgi:hypothetical protein
VERAGPLPHLRRGVYLALTDRDVASDSKGLLIPLSTLRAISEHVSYEINMWCATTDMLGERLWHDVEGPYRVDTAKNALLEAFTLHTRALMDFLYGEPRGDDVSARHFFTQNEWDAMMSAPEPSGYTPGPRIQGFAPSRVSPRD